MNLISYGYAGGPPGPIELSVEARPDGVVVCIADRARPFGPDEAAAPALDASWEERPIGGLGWHLIKELMDEVRYESADGVNRLTLVRRRA